MDTLSQAKAKLGGEEKNDVIQHKRYYRFSWVEMLANEKNNQGGGRIERRKRNRRTATVSNCER